MSVSEIRSQFPILSHTVFGKPLVYLDNAATAQRPQAVVNLWQKLALEENANIHRAVHHGDLFISVDSVRENASFYGTEFADELNRVIVHGLLHLIGYDDHTEEDIAVMRAKENYYLSQRPNV